MRMKPPVSRFSLVGVERARGGRVLRLQTPISLRSSVLAARCSRVLTLTWYFGVRHGADRPRAELEQVRASGRHRLLGHPDDVRLELVGRRRRVLGRDDHVAAADVDLVGQGDRDRLAGDGLWQVAVERSPAASTVLAMPGGQDAHAIPGRQGAAG